MSYKKLRSLTCFMIGLTLLFYAVPRLPNNGIADMATGFSVIWVLFAVIVISANLHHAMGLDFEEQTEYRRAKQAEWWKKRMGYQKGRSKRMRRTGV